MDNSRCSWFPGPFGDPPDPVRFMAIRPTLANIARNGYRDAGAGTERHREGVGRLGAGRVPARRLPLLRDATPASGLDPDRRLGAGSRTDREPEYGIVLDLGCGIGANGAYLAQRGNVVTGLDWSRWQLKRARGRWSFLDRRPQWVYGEAAEYLKGTGRFDLVLSALGAFDTVEAEDLLPALRGRINPGGVLAFSVTTLAGARRLPKGHPAPTAVRPVSDWERLLPGWGFTAVRVEEIHRPRSPRFCPWAVISCYTPG